MALPKQIEQQMREIEELEKQLAAQSEPPEPSLESEPPPEQQAEPDTSVPNEPIAEVKPNEPTTPEVSEETWQQKYRTLKGMYDAEVPRLHAQVKELQMTVARLQQAEVEAKPTRQATPTTSTKRETLVTDEDVAAFGADLIEVQRKVAREVAMEFGDAVDSLKAENDELRKQISHTGTQMGEMTFEQRLHRMVPDFDNLNNDPKWVSWLDEFDPILRSPRRSVAQSAFNSGDAEGVAYYVNLFRSLTLEATPTVDTKQAEVERQVQPSRTAASQAPASQKGKLYSTRDVEKMFQKVTQLHSTQKFDEAKKLEAEIDAAYMDGRVTA